jgi:hypothetical protein
MMPYLIGCLPQVETHGKEGERQRYFDDDDHHDLKTLVEMEKLGTAEDQNSMFARLAGRVSTGMGQLLSQCC